MDRRAERLAPASTRGVARTRACAAALRIAVGLSALASVPACELALGLEDLTPMGDDSGASSSVASDAAVLPQSDATQSPDAAAPADASADVSADATPVGAFDSSVSGDAAAPPEAGAAPVALVLPGSHTPLAMTEDDAGLYWTDLYGVVYRTDKSSGALTILYSYTATGAPYAIAVDGANVYWSDGDGVWACPKGGCGSSGARTQIVPVNKNRNDIHALAVDGHNVYWTDDSTFQVSSAPLGGADAGAPLWTGTTSPQEIVTDGQRVYFTAGDGLLHVVGTDGGTVTPATVGTPNDAGSLGIAYANQTVFWTVSALGSGQILSAPTSTLAPTPITAGQNLPNAVASDGLSVYWLDFGLNENGALMGCSILNCKPATVYSPIETPRAVVVDSTSLYWVDQGTGAIWRISK